MMVLNDNEWAEEMISNCSLGNKPFETLYRVARYYLDSNYSKKDVRNTLDKFLIRCDPSVSLPKWSKALDYALARAIKYKAVNIDYIPITDKEIEIIDNLSGVQIKRLAFTLLCLSKYWDKVKPGGDHWVNNKDSEIMKLANIKSTVKQQSKLYHELNKLGLIQFSRKVDSTNVRVCFATPGEEVLQITDLRNLGYQYFMFKGEPYFKCQCCGIVEKIRRKGAGAPQKYCKPCAEKIAIRQRVNSVMRRRQDKNLSSKSQQILRC